ncbi:uncharacterized protein LOC133174568 [Saccostrea echinata]|uniref:uncharacterized protein LOC133174568 n=1 Tax=Saccostrea echinata TaxID=191078 RepID=UPI002A82112F|nr:uncharacterized protein LOC133174568 [Saccostrea echinata]
MMFSFRAENVNRLVCSENGEIPDLYRVKLDDFLFTTGLKLTPDNVRRLKFALQGNLKTKSSRRYKTLTKINDGVELLKFMDHLYDFSMNIYILQGFLERIDEDGLVEKCIEFVERKTNTYINKYYKKRETLEGYKKVSLKLPKEDVHKIPEGRIPALKRNLMNLIDANFDDIVILGISEGCVIVHTEMRPLLFPKIKKLGTFADFIFKKYHISEVYSDQLCLYTSQKKGTSNVGKNCFQIEHCLTIEQEEDVIAKITELPDLPDSLNYINIAIMGAPLQGDFTFVNMCTEALKSRTAIQTRAALMTTSSNSTTPLTVISSKTKSGRPIQIRILESENIQTMDSIVDSSTCANEASTGRRSLSELDRKIHCVVYALDACEETLYGYDEIDNEKIKNSVLNQEKPKVLLLWTKNFSEMTFQDVFRFRVQACDEFGLPLRLIMPACDPLSNETHTNEALKSLLDMINRSIEYASKSSQ